MRDNYDQNEQETMRIAQGFRQLPLKFLTGIIGLWCIYLSYDKTPFGEFEIVATATGWSFIAAATSLLVMTPFYYLDKHLQATVAPESPPLAVVGSRIIGRCTLIISVLAMLSLLAFALTLLAFLLTKTYVIIRLFL